LQLFARAAYQGDPQLAERLVIPIASKLREMVSDILNQAAARGEIRPQIDLEAAIRLVYGLSIAVADSQLLPYLNNYFQILSPGLSPERILAAMLDFIESGIAVDGRVAGAGSDGTDANTLLPSPTGK